MQLSISSQKVKPILLSFHQATLLVYPLRGSLSESILSTGHQGIVIAHVYFTVSSADKDGAFFHWQKWMQLANCFDCYERGWSSHILTF